MAADYEAAKARLAAVEQRRADYDGNNPNKYESEWREAREQFAAAEAEAKRLGLIPMTEREQLHAELDRAFPDARSKEIVVHNNIRYRRRFSPLTRSNSGKSVREWSRSWELVADDG